MKLPESRGISCPTFQSNELLESSDMRQLSVSAYNNIIHALKARVGESRYSEFTGYNNFILHGLTVESTGTVRTVRVNAGAALSDSGRYFTGSTFEFVKSYGEMFYVCVPEDITLGFVANPDSTNSRIDIIEIRPMIDTYSEKTRQFRDPVTSAISSAIMDVMSNVYYEIHVVQGTVGSGVAPTSNEGWIKLAEVTLPKNNGDISSIVDCRNCITWKGEASTSLYRTRYLPWEDNPSANSDYAGYTLSTQTLLGTSGIADYLDVPEYTDIASSYILGTVNKNDYGCVIGSAKAYNSEEYVFAMRGALDNTNIRFEYVDLRNVHTTGDIVHKTLIYDTGTLVCGEVKISKSVQQKGVFVAAVGLTAFVSLLVLDMTAATPTVLQDVPISAGSGSNYVVDLCNTYGTNGIVSYYNPSSGINYFQCYTVNAGSSILGTIGSPTACTHNAPTHFKVRTSGTPVVMAWTPDNYFWVINLTTQVQSATSSISSIAGITEIVKCVEGYQGNDAHLIVKTATSSYIANAVCSASAVTFGPYSQFPLEWFNFAAKFINAESATTVNDTVFKIYSPFFGRIVTFIYDGTTYSFEDDPNTEFFFEEGSISHIAYKVIAGSDSQRTLVVYYINQYGKFRVRVKTVGALLYGITDMYNGRNIYSGVVQVQGSLLDTSTYKSGEYDLFLNYNGKLCYASGLKKQADGSPLYKNPIRVGRMVDANYNRMLLDINFNNWHTPVLAFPIVRARATIVNTQTPTASNTVIQFNSIDDDIYDAITTGASWNFKAPFTGDYIVSFQLSASVSQAGPWYVNFYYKVNTTPSNVVTKLTCGSSAQSIGCDTGGAFIVRLKAGDALSLTWTATAALTANVAAGLISITLK